MIVCSRVAIEVMLTAGVMMVAGCAPIGQSEPKRPDCHACEELHGASRPDPEPVTSAADDRSRTIALVDADPSVSDRFLTTRIGYGEEPASPRPPRRRKIDVELLRAPFADAVRFLAESGRFDVVIEAPSASDVTVSLHGVDPYDALELIAEAKGLDVRTRRGVVIVAPTARTP